MKRRLPSLSALRAFEAAARHRSVKRAAEELSVTPTAISHQVRLLEDALGIALFLRRPRQLHLTPEGRELQGVLSEALDDIATTIERLRAAPARQAITLSTTPAVAARWLLPWVCLLRDSHPQLDLRIHAGHVSVPLDGITADMAVRYGEGSWPGLASEKLFDNHFVPACSPALGLTDPAQLPAHTLIHFEPQSVSVLPPDWNCWQKQARVPNLEVSAGLRFSDETHAITAAIDGQGVALMSRHLIADELQRRRLVQPFGPALEADPFYLVYPEARRNEPAIRAVREWVLALSHGTGFPAAHT
jgi:LysR family transcriptional regulator, glycine cleavage system transcriptional activator